VNSTYARARLGLGIRGVGTLVVLATLGLVLDLPTRLSGLAADVLGTDPDALSTGMLAFVLLVLGYVAVSLPFDFLGGVALPRRFGRPFPDVPVFFGRWLRGVVIQAVVLVASGSLVLAAGRIGGLAAAIAAILLAMLALLATSPWLARLVGSLRVAPHDGADAAHDVVTLAGADPGFTGGIAGLPGIERIVLPQAWRKAIGADATRWLLERRRELVRSGARLRGVLIAMGWNLGGFLLLAVSLPGAGVDTGAGLLTIALGGVLWQFLGLLLLPSLSRPGVIAGDVALLASGTCSRKELEAALRTLDRMQDDEPRRGRWTERVFHPIPALDARLAAWDHAASAPAAWNTARTSLFLSWASFGLLSRAVHCNAGRPECWVHLPCD
jgi:hypothetical protein